MATRIVLSNAQTSIIASIMKLMASIIKNSITREQIIYLVRQKIHKKKPAPVRIAGQSMQLLSNPVKRIEMKIW